MKRFISFVAIGIALLMLFACSPSPYSGSDAASPTIELTTTASHSSTTLPQDMQEAVSFPFSETGMYFTGKQEFSLIDERRSGREIEIIVWYPALKQTEPDGRAIVRDAMPDMSGVPYPLILTGKNSGGKLFQSHLASHGFAMAIIQSPGFSYEAPWNNDVIDVPLDFLFVLDQLASNPPQGLKDVLDTNRVGVAGYSSDGLFSLALGGARVNPDYYFSQCAQAPALNPPLSPYLIKYFCQLSERWDEFSSQVGTALSAGSTGLWQPTTDDRILAVMPMAPDSAWLYGAEGLADIHIPALILAGSADEMAPYKMGTCYAYEHLVNSDRILISFIGRKHMMIEDNHVIDRINHFAVSFFGYYLQGHQEYADYFSEDFVAQFEDLAWGVYLEK